MDSSGSPAETPLEGFLRDYLETVDGAWDEVEPQVYDVLLPEGDGLGMLRLAFDPEAVPEHPGSQLASFGTPLIDKLLGDALRRGQSAHFYLIGLNLEPHNLVGKVRKSLTLANPLEMEVKRARALHFTQAVYWFQAEFVSDQKEQTIMPVAIDLHYGREVRHLEALLNPGRLAKEPVQPLPEARRQSVALGYTVAREQVLRTLAALANVRARELGERRDRQIARLKRYYADLRGELDEQAGRSRNAEEAAERLEQRRTAIGREEQLRVAELVQKSQLRAHLRLLQMAKIDQPKVLLQATLTAPKMASVAVELVWDPLTEALEALPCPRCGRPTFILESSRIGVQCPGCVGKLGVR